MSLELLHLLSETLERAGISLSFAAAVGVYLVTGMLLAVGFQITKVRLLRAGAILAAMIIIVSLLGLHLFPDRRLAVIVMAIIPGVFYIQACYYGTRDIDRP